MSEIKFHLVERTQPGVAGGGERKFYASIAQRETISLKELSDEIAEGRTLTPTDVRAVLISLSRKLPKYLLKGSIIDLGDVGKLFVNLSSEGSTTEEEFRTSMIKKAKVIFKPSQDISKQLKLASFTKINGNEE